MTENILPQEPPNDNSPKSADVLKIGRNIIQERFFFFLILAVLLLLTLMLIWPNLIAILTAIALIVIIKPLYNWIVSSLSVAGTMNGKQRFKGV